MPTGDQIEGVAIVGDGQYLAFTPCCNQPIRLAKAEVKPVNAVRCPKNSRLWDLEFVKRGVEWKAVWTHERRR